MAKVISQIWTIWKTLWISIFFIVIIAAFSNFLAFFFSIIIQGDILNAAIMILLLVFFGYLVYVFYINATSLINFSHFFSVFKNSNSPGYYKKWYKQAIVIWIIILILRILQISSK